MVRKAIVLAAGLGTRLRPLTCRVPKPLLPVWGETMLGRIVRQLRAWGVGDVVVNGHCLHEQIEAWCLANGCRFAREPVILGTGGALNPLRDWIAQDDFYLVSGGIVMEGLETFRGLPEPALPEALGTCLLTEAGPRTVEREPMSGLVTNWRSDDAGFPGTYAYCGVARLRAKVLDFVEPTGFSEIEQAYERAAAAGLFLQGLVPEDLTWTDVGTLRNYLELNAADDENGFGFLPQLRAVGAEKVELLGADERDRVTFRSDNRVVIVYDDARCGENARYAAHARWLAECGVPVPKVLSDDPTGKTLVFAWAGAERKMTLEENVRVIESLATFNGLDAQALDLEPPLDASLYASERSLFAEHCLGARYFLTMSDAVRLELENVAALLLREPYALVHRDFQSANVLWKNGAFSFVGFQGMRLGPAALDLAAFVYDPRVRFTEGARRALVALYGKKTGRPEIVKTVPFAAVQRLVQCLGAYGRLAGAGQPQSLRFVLSALENLLAAADEAGLDALGALAEDLIGREMKLLHPHAQDPLHGQEGETCSCGGHHRHDVT